MSENTQQPIVKRVPRHDDARGWFISTYTDGLPVTNWVMQNVSLSHKGVVRGLHFQKPRAQNKLLTLITGAVRDVIININPQSDRFGEVQVFDLSADDDSQANQIFVPRGYAHGFSAQTENALICYLTDELWHPEDEKTIDPFDADLGIEWCVNEPTVSNKDSRGMSWKSIMKGL